MTGNKNVDGEHDWVVLECRDPNLSEQPPGTAAEIFISTADISSWDLPSILTHQIIKVKINRTRLIEHSPYFHSLLCGSFSESSMLCIPIHWNCDTFLHILRFIHGCHTEVTISTFLSIYHAALYFGLEMLVSKCRDWFSNVLVMEGPSFQLKLDDIVRFWEFGLEHAIDWISGLCINYVARNFMWAFSRDTFVDLPYGFLVSTVKHPHLTVDSERHLCEALLAWLHANMEPLGQTGRADSADDSGSDKSKQMIMITHDWTSILEEVHGNLLPLWFIMGKSRCRYFSEIAKQGTAATIKLLKRLSEDPNLNVGNSDQSYMNIRITKYSKKLDLSGCPQITSSVLLLSILYQTTSVSPLLLEGIGRKSMDLECPRWLLGLSTVSYEAMVEVNISNCPLLHLGAAMECFRKSFSFLRTVRMAYFLDFGTKLLCQLIENYSSVCEIDLTVDVSPLTFPNLSVLYSESVSRPALKRYFNMSSCSGRRPTSVNITKLTLEGRSDFSDLEFNHIAEVCVSLCFLNIRGCLSVSDSGIANVILRCRKLHSIIATDTTFGRNSASALCSRDLDIGYCEPDMDKKLIEVSDIYLQVLHIGACKDVSEASLCEILSRGRMLKNLCLRDTFLADHALFSFPGSSLEILDVSYTMISRDALSQMLNKNPGLKCLEAKGCKNLCPNQIKNDKSSLLLSPRDKLFSVLGQEYKLEELTVGWGFSFFSLNSTGSGLRYLKSINVGLGGSLGPEGLTLLCALCPLLESVTILFQMISDSSIMNLLGTLRNLQALSICYCIGDLSPSCLNHSVPNLRILKLDRVTPWMTNDDLTLLAQNCANLVELSLVGCMHLDVDSQQIISSGWPGLISLHLEDCGAVTADGTSFIFDCKALEHLLLRHNDMKDVISHLELKQSSRAQIIRPYCDTTTQRSSPSDSPRHKSGTFHIKMIVRKVPNLCLGESNGELRCVVVSQYGLMIWALEDCFNSKWDVKSFISFEVMDGESPQYLYNLAERVSTSIGKLVPWMQPLAFKDGKLFIRVSNFGYSFDIQTTRICFLCDVIDLGHKFACLAVISYFVTVASVANS